MAGFSDWFTPCVQEVNKSCAFDFWLGFSDYFLINQPTIIQTIFRVNKEIRNRGEAALTVYEGGGRRRLKITRALHCCAVMLVHCIRIQKEKPQWPSRNISVPPLQVSVYVFFFLFLYNISSLTSQVQGKEDPKGGTHNPRCTLQGQHLLCASARQGEGAEAILSSRENT